MVKPKFFFRWFFNFFSRWSTSRCHKFINIWNFCLLQCKFSKFLIQIIRFVTVFGKITIFRLLPVVTDKMKGSHSSKLKAETKTTRLQQKYTKSPFRMLQMIFLKIFSHFLQVIFNWNRTSTRTPKKVKYISRMYRHRHQSICAVWVCDLFHVDLICSFRIQCANGNFWCFIRWLHALCIWPHHIPHRQIFMK